MLRYIRSFLLTLAVFAAFAAFVTPTPVQAAGKCRCGSQQIVLPECSTSHSDCFDDCVAFGAFNTTIYDEGDVANCTVPGGTPINSAPPPPVTSAPASVTPTVVSTTTAPATPKKGSIFIPECAFSETTTPGLDCVLEAFLGISRFILSIVGSVTLVIFVVAGFLFIWNSGNAGEAAKAMGKVKNAGVGLVIILCSGIAVNYFQAKIKGQTGQTGPASCAALGPTYSCLVAKSGSTIRCKQGLCQAGTECCEKDTPENVNRLCAPFGKDFKCMVNTQGTECKTGYCPGADNFQCCKSSSGAGAAPKPPAGAITKELGCFDYAFTPHDKLGCTAEAIGCNGLCAIRYPDPALNLQFSNFCGRTAGPGADLSCP